MNDQEKQDYLARYHAAKEKGSPFFPDIIFKDTVVVLLVFIVLMALAPQWCSPRISQPAGSWLVMYATLS